MPKGFPGAISFCLALGLLSIVLGTASLGQTVWSGLTHSFSKPDGSDGGLAENQDFITLNAIFARGYSAGLYNAATEPNWNGSGPEFTEWATVLVPGNEELDENDIVATNYASLQFTDWLPAFGGGGDQSLHTNLEAHNTVVHLMLDDVYLDLKFDYWGAGHFGGSGGFSYLRAEPPAPETTGDYNGDHVVDAADYTVWRDTLGTSADPFGSGADGVADGTIDQLDYDFWKQHFGQTVAGSGGSALAVPEPATWLLFFAAAAIMSLPRKLSPRGPGQGFFRIRRGDFSCVVTDSRLRRS
jgi:hypothetical protein